MILVICIFIVILFTALNVVFLIAANRNLRKIQLIRSKL